MPHKLQVVGAVLGLDQVWNLVLACWNCNRGPGGKFDSIPALPYINRLARRNEYLISSHHPLRETLLAQTGTTPAIRHRFLQGVLNAALDVQPARWATQALEDPTF